MNHPYTILTGDCRDTMKTVDAGSVHCCVTSPPYYGLRDYGCDGQIGLEASPKDYVEQLVVVFREVRRVLRIDGTLWLNLGDSYSGSWGAQGRPQGNGAMNGRSVCSARQIGAHPRFDSLTGNRGKEIGLKPKDLMGIPWRVAFALQEDGWYLRQEIIWHKPNPMPESVTDRCTKAHEHIFLLSKSPHYYFDAVAIQERSANSGEMRSFCTTKKQGRPGAPPVKIGEYRNLRSVWTVPTKPYSGAHFATFPPELIRPCILAGTSEEGCCSVCGAPFMRIGETVAKTTGWNPSCECENPVAVPCTVLDPFGGSGTTAEVAISAGCRSISCEINPEYVKLQKNRLQQGSLLV